MAYPYLWLLYICGFEGEQIWISGLNQVKTLHPSSLCVSGPGKPQRDTATGSNASQSRRLVSRRPCFSPTGEAAESQFTVVLEHTKGGAGGGGGFEQEPRRNVQRIETGPRSKLKGIKEEDD